jgi:hypothetical protein
MQRIYYFVDRNNRTRRQPPAVTAVFLKKGDFNNPPLVHFCKRKNGGFD